MPTLKESKIHIQSRLRDAPAKEAAALQLELAQKLCWVSGYEAKQYIDNILADETLSAEAVIRIKAELLLVGYYMNRMELQAAWNIAEKTLAKAMASGNSELIITTKAAIISAAAYNGHKTAANNMLAECLAAVEQIDDKCLQYDIYTTAALHSMEVNLSAALNYAQRAMDLAEGITPWRIGYAAMVTGYVVGYITGLKNEVKYFKLAADSFLKDEATEYYATALQQLSIAYKDVKEYNKAEECLAIAQPIFQTLNNPRHLINLYYTYGRLYRARQMFQQSIFYYEKAVELSITNNNTYEEATAYALMGQMYRDKGDINTGINYLEKALAVFDQSNQIRNCVSINKHLHPLYWQTGQIEKAYTALNYYTENTLAIMNESRSKEVAALQEKYDAEKREAELKESKLQHAESELKALKAQMNPHFIFNSLNSIQEIFFLGDKQLANEHLSRFSQLMRNILKASGRALITLHEEIQMLEEYLALEALRFGTDFSFNIIRDDNVDIYTLDVPPMIIQPFVENAVKHGLQHREGTKLLNIQFTFDEENTIITAVVSDNGIGRAASALINSKRVGHQSFATSAISRRFEVLNSNREHKFAYHYVDALNDKGMATGTQVHITIPVED